MDPLVCGKLLTTHRRGKDVAGGLVGLLGKDLAEVCHLLILF